jgi:O-antigen/teichoic acid export membrane protein
MAVVVFSTLRTLTRFSFQMMLSISNAFEPEMAAAWGRNEKSELVRLYINNLRLGFWLTLCAVASLFILGGWIVRVWTHGKVLLDATLFNWLLVSALVSALWYGGFYLLKAGNRHLRAAFWSAFASLTAVLLAALLLRNTGRLPVVGQALVVMEGLIMVYVFRSAATFIGLTPGYVLRSVLDLRSLIRGIIVIVGRTSIQ